MEEGMGWEGVGPLTLGRRHQPLGCRPKVGFNDSPSKILFVPSTHILLPPQKIFLYFSSPPTIPPIQLSIYTITQLFKISISVFEVKNHAMYVLS